MVPCPTHSFPSEGRSELRLSSLRSSKIPHGSRKFVPKEASSWAIFFQLLPLNLLFFILKDLK